MIINKIQNNQISYKSQPSPKEKISDNWTYLTGLITLPVGGYLGWKNCKDKFEKEHKSLLSEKEQETIKSMDLIPESEVCLKKQNALLEKLKELEPEKKRILKELDDMSIPESKLRQDLQTSCSDKILRFNANLPTEMPKSIMLIGDNKNFGEKIAKWLSEQGKAHFLSTNFEAWDNYIDDIAEKLSNNEKIKKWTVLYISDLEEAINPSITESWIIEEMKSRFSICTDDYYSTVIFQTKDPSQLDSIAIQLHRVNKQLDINNIDEKKFFEYERLKEKEKEIFEEMKPYEKRLNEISEQIQKVHNLDAKIKELENNKNFNKGIAFGVIAGAMISGCLILINKFITKGRNKKNVNAN